MTPRLLSLFGQAGLLDGSDLEQYAQKRGKHKKFFEILLTVGQMDVMDLLTAEIRMPFRSKTGPSTFGDQLTTVTHVRDDELLHMLNAATSVAAVQVQYSLIDRSAEREILPCCRELGISVITYGPLAQGLLTGKYDAETRFGRDDCRRHLQHFRGEELQANMATVDRLREIAMKRQKSPGQLAMRWALDHPGVSSIIVGTKSRDQLKQNVGAQGWRLDPADYRYLVSG